MNNNGKQLTLTVAIPTCYGGESLLATARDLRNSKGVDNFRFIICADRTPISPEIKSELSKLGVELIWNDKEGSQFKKIKQTINLCDSDIYVSTQDDITFPPDTLKATIDAFAEDPELTMAGARLSPLKPQNLFESAMATVVLLMDSVGRKWNNGQNYLMASGRCLAFRTSRLKKFDMPERVINGDTFLYLENKRLGGKFRNLKEAPVCIRCPQKMSDQLGPSSRYQYSQKEMSEYFGQQVLDEYKIPFKVLISCFLKEFIKHPMNLIYYAGIFIYTRIKKQPVKKVSNPVWDIDVSTKQVNK